MSSGSPSKLAHRVIEMVSEQANLYQRVESIAKQKEEHAFLYTVRCGH